MIKVILFVMVLISVKGYYIYANGFSYQTKAFSLPGRLPNAVNENMNTISDNPVVYPNPNNGSFFVSLYSRAGDVNTLDLYSGSGKLIDTYRSRDNPVHINKSGLSDGIYLLNNHSGKMNSTNKVMIEK